MRESKPLPTVVEAYRRLTGRDPQVIGKRRGDELYVPCVAPQNHTNHDAGPSLRINTAKDVWTCVCAGVDGGKSVALVVAAGRARDTSEAARWLNPPDEPVRVQKAPPIEKHRWIEDYEYTALDGPVLYRVRRLEARRADGSISKEFPQHRMLPDGTWDHWLGNDVQRVPYHFAKMVCAASEGQPIVLVEGEKDVHNVEKLGIAATTSPGGSDWKWTPEFIDCFRGIVSVVVIGDNDTHGRAAARARAEALSLVCGTVRLVESIPGVKEKGDASDWLRDHPDATADDFWAMINDAAVLVGVDVDDGNVVPMQFWVVGDRLAEKQTVVVPSIPFSIKSFDSALGGMQLGRVTVLAARTNQGKTAVAAMMSWNAAESERVMVFSFEMGQEQWYDRVLAKRHGTTPLDFRRHLRPMRPGDREENMAHDISLVPNGKDATIERIEHLVSIHQPKLVVIDHLRHIKGWLGGKKQQRADLAASEIMYAFPDLAKKYRAHFLLLHQLNRQAGDEPTLADLRDAGAVEEVADNVILLQRPFKTVNLDPRPADHSLDDDVMHAMLAKSREGAEIYAHLVWHGPTMTARPWESYEEAHTKRCCANKGGGGRRPAAF